MDLAEGLVFTFDRFTVAGDKIGWFPGVAFGDKKRLAATGVCVFSVAFSSL